jgi:protein gp37
VGERTGISYAHHTFSPWWGCTKISEECLNCYAEKVGARREVEWGKGKPRRLISDATWKLPERWAHAADATGERRRVLPSMCDFLDSEVPAEWRERFYALVRDTSYALDWMLLTKRAERLLEVPEDVLAGAWVGITAGTQPRLKERAKWLLRVPARLRFVSAEPLLGPLELGRLRYHLTRPGEDGINLVIVGCESGPGARPMDLDWARRIRDDCAECDGAVFYLKQAMVDGKLVKLPLLDGHRHDQMPAARAA